MNCDLSSISVGTLGMITELPIGTSMAKRFNDIGLVAGTMIECLQINAGKSLILLLFRGSRFAFRTEDLIGIRYRKINRF